MKTKEELHRYWENPNDKNNNPEGYLDNEITLRRSKYLFEVISKHFPSKETKILELGSNVGRNLNYLYERGYKNLTGVEINENAIAIMKDKYPDCYKNIQVVRGAIEDFIIGVSFYDYDLVLAMAVLEHIHPESEWIFDNMMQSFNYALTIENEVTASDRHCPRNYFNVFGKDMKQIAAQGCGTYNGFSKRFVMRLFEAKEI